MFCRKSANESLARLIAASSGCAGAASGRLLLALETRNTGSLSEPGSWANAGAAKQAPVAARARRNSRRARGFRVIYGISLRGTGVFAVRAARAVSSSMNLALVLGHSFGTRASPKRIADSHYRWFREAGMAVIAMPARANYKNEVHSPPLA